MPSLPSCRGDRWRKALSGVLKADRIKFAPPLPATHREALEGLAMGLLDKYWFRFDRPFWTEKAEMWTRSATAASPFAEWFNLLPSTGQPVLLALLGGSVAREWSARTDGDVAAAAQLALAEFIAASW